MSSKIPLRRRDRIRLQKKQIRFQRPGGDPFIDGPRATDPRQGTIGDCYLLCSFSALAHTRPNAIESMMRRAGARYRVRFHRRLGNNSYRPEQIRVDDSVPFEVEHRQPVYARTRPDARGRVKSWPLILEKAYAAWKGGYHIIGEGGAVEDTLEELTGEPTRMLFTAEHNPDVLWEMLAAATHERWPATACTYGRVERPGLDELGLHPNHIHILLGVHSWRGRRIVWLRDPFDRPASGQIVLPDPDGLFTISWDQFLTYFAEIHINGKKIFNISSPPYPMMTLRQCLDRSYVFRKLDITTKRLLADDFRRVTFDAGRTIVISGSQPDYFYFIKSGSAEVTVREKRTGRKICVAVLRAGDQFGEMALINHSVRLADVAAQTELVAFRLPAARFQKWIEERPELVRGFRRRFELQTWMQQWSRRPITSVSLDALLQAGTIESHRRGGVIFRQGDTADSFYIVLEGRVEVYHVGKGGRRKRIKIFGSGDVFGEVAALKHAPRTASVRALTPVRALKIDIHTTAQVVEHFEVMQRQLEFIARRRARKLRKMSGCR